MGSRAINRDLKALFKQNIFETELPDEDNIFVIDLIIKCGGNWEGITQKFRTKIPLNYPFSYPSVTCLESEKTLHPNIQPSDGSVCLGILSSEQWKAMFSLTDVCSALSSMFTNPNWEHSLNQEAFQLFHDNKIEFDRRLRAIRNISTSDKEVKTEAAVPNDATSEVLSVDTVEAKTSTNENDSPKGGGKIVSKKQKKAGTTSEIPSDPKKGSAATICASGVNGIDINGDVIKNTSSSSNGDLKATGTSTPAKDKLCGECSPSSRKALSKMKDNEDSESKNDEQCSITETVAMVRTSYYECHHTLINTCNLFVVLE